MVVEVVSYTLVFRIHVYCLGCALHMPIEGYWFLYNGYVLGVLLLVTASLANIGYFTCIAL